MIKVAATHEARSHVLELANVFRARVVDVAPESLTIEITGAEDKIDGSARSAAPLRRAGNGAHRHRRHAARKQTLRRAVITGSSRANHDGRRSLAVGLAPEKIAVEATDDRCPLEEFRKDFDGYLPNHASVARSVNSCPTTDDGVI